MPQATSRTSFFSTTTTVTIDIDAPADKVMSLLTDAENFCNWNSTLIAIKGQIKQAEQLHVFSKLTPKRMFNFNVKELSPLSMVWQEGRMPALLVLRSFKLEPKSGGSCIFTMTEVFKGFMWPFMKSGFPDYRPDFEQYAADLKAAAEGTTSGRGFGA